MQPVPLLAAYSVAIVAASAFGLWLQQTIRLTHTKMQFAMSFVAGLILGVALYHLIPQSVGRISGPEALETAVWWIVAGLVLMVVLLRVCRFHRHDLQADRGNLVFDPGQGSSGERSLGWLGIAVGLGMHSLAEGTALGASLRGSLHGQLDALLVSLGVFLAIVFHKPLDAFSILGMMRLAGTKQRSAIAINIGIAGLCPIGAFATYWGIGLFGPGEAEIVGRALALTAGSLLCISLSDLLPELHLHGHDRFLLTGALLGGISLAYALHWLETVSHL